MSDVLNEILMQKRREVDEARLRLPLSDLRAFLADREPALDFTAALSEPGVQIIAECKRKSPSRGIIAADYDPEDQAQAYAAGGCAAISVLTDEPFFGGSLAHLEAVREVVTCPILRKDFIIDEYQIYEARHHAADSYLLLAGAHDLAALQYLIEVGRDLGMEPLVEAHSQAEVDLALATDAKIIGINNRDLKTMRVDFSTSLGLARYILDRDDGRVLVCESGITSRQAVDQARAAGYKAFLVGEYLMTHADPTQALLELTEDHKD